MSALSRIVVGGLLLGVLISGCAPTPPKPPTASSGPPAPPPGPPPPPGPVPPPATSATNPPVAPPPPPAGVVPANAAAGAAPIVPSPPAAANQKTGPAALAEVVVPPVNEGEPPPITLARGAAGDVPPGLKGTPIQARQGETIVWGPYPSTCLAIIKDGEEAHVWDAATGKQIGRPLTGLVRSSKFALSPDGRRLALLAVVGQQTGVGIWSTETGKSAVNFQYAEKARYSDWMLFAGPDQLLIAQPEASQSVLEIWDAAAGKALRQISGPAYVREETTAVSPDGKRLASFHCLSKSRVTVYDLNTGEIATELPPPGTHSSCEGLAFSAGGEELAGLFGAGSDTLLVSWTPDKREQVLRWNCASAAKNGVKGAISYKGPAVQWLPDRSGLLLYGHYLVDRQSQRVVWTIHTADDDHQPAERRFIDNDRLAVSTGPGSGLRRAQLVLLPWKRINASLAAMEGNAAALLKPGQAASLEIEMGSLRGGTVEATRDVLAEAIAAALAERRIDLADDAPVVVQMKYREEQGEELEELARGSGPGGLPFPGALTPPGGQGATGTGRKLKATHIYCDLALRRRDKPAILWSSSVDLNPRTLLIQGDFTDAAARESSLRQVAHTLSQQAFPYFIPAEEGLTALPGVTKLPGAGNRAGVKLKSGRK